ncbi:Os12g0257400 [Oryza sativa Japonica Group]|uniref:Os12g0257400 protein n=1 Tax=Oryza sativa subsp. japonica TaxID=39947 RepID=A0A0P0Y8Q3_ORYSJ|nr:hypothetical protein EE612_058711 [Oryza sativa]BAT16571.1 Os12g0257400 [Oryza sativa Japonica Group]
MPDQCPPRCRPSHHTPNRRAFITATAPPPSSIPLGFCTTRGKKMQMMELYAFLGHVGSTSLVQVGLATGGLTAWGSPTIRDEPPGGLLRQDKLTIPRVKGAECYGRGAIPVIW